MGRRGDGGRRLRRHRPISAGECYRSALALFGWEGDGCHRDHSGCRSLAFWAARRCTERGESLAEIGALAGTIHTVPADAIRRVERNCDAAALAAFSLCVREGVVRRRYGQDGSIDGRLAAHLRRQAMGKKRRCRGKDSLWHEPKEER